MSKVLKSPVYLTKERLSRAVKNGIKEAAVEAKAKVDIIVVEEGGWIVSKHRDGTVERLDKVTRPSRLAMKKKVAKLING